MNHRRYDQIVGLVASVLFGFGVRSLHSFQAALRESWDIDWRVAVVVVLGFTLVYFRNIHGLFAYDIWAENEEYIPRFEQTYGLLAFFFMFAVVAVVLLPFLGIHLFAGHAELIKKGGDLLFVFLLFGPLAAYMPWNLHWMHKLTPPRAMDSAGIQLVSYTRSWLGLDLFTWLALSTAVVLVLRLDDDLLRYDLVGITYGLCAVVVVGVDYYSNASYYFPRPTFPRGRHYFYEEEWDVALEDGRAFCHWGGVKASERVCKEVRLRNARRVLDVGCGFGGTLSMVAETPGVGMAVGVDVSYPALMAARNRSRGRGHEAMVLGGAAGELPVSSESMDLVIYQDCDAWIQGQPTLVCREAARVLRSGGTLIIQTYWENEAIPREVQQQSRLLLKRLGYAEFVGVSEVELTRVLRAEGFRIERRRSLQRDYKSSAREMRDRYLVGRDPGTKSLLGEWLSWSCFLFDNEYWSGTFVVATLRR